MRTLLHPYLSKLFISADLQQHSVKAHNRPTAPLCSKSISLLIPILCVCVCVCVATGAVQLSHIHSKVKIVNRTNLLKELIDVMIAGKAVSAFPLCSPRATPVSCRARNLLLETKTTVSVNWLLRCWWINKATQANNRWYSSSFPQREKIKDNNKSWEAFLFSSTFLIVKPLYVAVNLQTELFALCRQCVNKACSISVRWINEWKYFSQEHLEINCFCTQPLIRHC